jgi:hypothetical protein
MRRGVLVHGPTGRSFTCLIVDVSLGGARLQLTAPEPLPEGQLSLIDGANATLHELRVAWRDPPFVGVAFIGTAPAP